jgi:hypothetical protein
LFFDLRGIIAQTVAISFVATKRVVNPPLENWVNSYINRELASKGGRYRQ